MKLILAAIAAFFSSSAFATDCAEWATMTQILVIRWQGDPSFKDKTLTQVRTELQRKMEGHPELDKALYYVDFAYKHKSENPVHIWQQVNRECNSITL